MAVTNQGSTTYRHREPHLRSDLSALHPSSRASFAKRSHSLTYRQPKFFRKHGSDETGFNYLPSSRASFAKRSLCSAPVIASLICEAISLLCTRHRELHLRSDLSPLHPSSRASFAKRSRRLPRTIFCGVLETARFYALGLPKTPSLDCWRPACGGGELKGVSCLPALCACTHGRAVGEGGPRAQQLDRVSSTHISL